MRTPGGIEASGTKFIYAVGTGPDDVRSEIRFPTTTPKPGWTNAGLAGAIGRVLGLPMGFDADVNGAALGEFRWGAA